MPEILNMSNHIHLSIEEARPFISDHTYPLYAANEYRCPEVIGACVFIELDGVSYLVTAAHVIDDIDGHESSVHLGGGSIIPINAEFICTSKDGKDPLDIAFCVMNDGLIQDQGINVLTIESTCDNKKFTNPHYFIAYGYPCIKNKFREAAKKKTKSTTIKALTYAGGLIDHKYYSINKMDASRHIGILYKNSKEKDGTRVTPPAPQGISGGGCWIVPDSFSAENVWLVGIFIENHGPHIYATKIDHVISFVRDNA